MAAKDDGQILARGRFENTHWSVVLRARDKSENALAMLCEAYRQPLLTWLCSRGNSPHDAEDLLQGFFATILCRNFLSNVAREKGTFRTFLLKCLINYLNDQRDKHNAEKRGRGVFLASLDEVDENGTRVHNPESHEIPPDQEYDRAWARTVLSNALRKLEAECTRQGHTALCQELQPVLFADETAVSYEVIASRLRMTEGAVKTAAHRIRARLKGLVREEVLQTVANENDWEDELKYLIQLFNR